MTWPSWNATWSTANGGDPTLTPAEPPAQPLAVASATSIRLTGDLLAQMIEHARSTAPEECCAICIGEPDTVRELHAVANVHETPVTRYQIGAADQLRVYRRAEEHGWDFTLVFHSHPATEAWPSTTDVALASWPDAVYAILSLTGDEPVLRAYRIVDGEITELTVAVAG